MKAKKQRTPFMYHVQGVENIPNFSMSGAKAKMRRWLITNFWPPKCRHYIEVCGGYGNLFYAVLALTEHGLLQYEKFHVNDLISNVFFEGVRAIGNVVDIQNLDWQIPCAKGSPCVSCIRNGEAGKNSHQHFDYFKERKDDPNPYIRWRSAIHMPYVTANGDRWEAGAVNPNSNVVQWTSYVARIRRANELMRWADGKLTVTNFDLFKFDYSPYVWEDLVVFSIPYRTTEKPGGVNAYSDLCDCWNCDPRTRPWRNANGKTKDNALIGKPCKHDRLAAWLEKAPFRWILLEYEHVNYNEMLGNPVAVERVRKTSGMSQKSNKHGVEAVWTNFCPKCDARLVLTPNESASCPKGCVLQFSGYELRFEEERVNIDEEATSLGDQYEYHEQNLDAARDADHSGCVLRHSQGDQQQQEHQPSSGVQQTSDSLVASEPESNRVPLPQHREHSEDGGQTASGLGTVHEHLDPSESRCSGETGGSESSPGLTAEEKI
jgi:hypothetical protein